MRLLAILIFLLSGCNGTGSVSPDASTFYKRDIRIAVAGHTYYGVAVLPSKARYTLDMEFSGTLDLFTFTDCHQQIARERAGNGGIFGPKNQIRIDYEPKFAQGTYCPIEIGGYEAEKGRHSWGFIDFKTDAETLPAVVECNGYRVDSDGVSVCQALEGLAQRITFPVPVDTSAEATCGKMESEDGKAFEFPISKGRCVFAFRERDGARRIHRLTTLGYEKIMIREVRP